MSHVTRKVFRALVPVLTFGALLAVPGTPAQAAALAFSSVHDGRCLDSDISNATHNGTKVQVWDCNGWDNQKWTRYTDGTIRSRHDGRCLDEDIAGGTGNGKQVQVWDCNGWDNQKWRR
jgi:hypothetical protein